MSREDAFYEWLRTQRKQNGGLLSDNSAKKYCRAIATVSSDMLTEGVIPASLFHVTDPKALDTHINGIKANHNFSGKNSIGHNMYSCALDHYLEFVLDVRVSLSK